MIELRRTAEFDHWLRRFEGCQSESANSCTYPAMQAGNPGDEKSLGGGLMEMRIDYGPGYRVYFTRRGNTIVILLCGGDKQTQRRDIRRARELAETADDKDGSF